MNIVDINIGDMVIFSSMHRARPGIGYVEGWTGIIIDKILDSSGVVEEMYILWDHGGLSDYPSSWWNSLPYEPFEVISESR